MDPRTYAAGQYADDFAWAQSSHRALPPRFAESLGDHSARCPLRRRDDRVILERSAGFGGRIVGLPPIIYKKTPWFSGFVVLRSLGRRSRLRVQCSMY